MIWTKGCSTGTNEPITLPIHLEAFPLLLLGCWAFKISNSCTRVIIIVSNPGSDKFQAFPRTRWIIWWVTLEVHFLQSITLSSWGWTSKFTEDWTCDLRTSEPSSKTLRHSFRHFWVVSLGPFQPLVVRPQTSMRLITIEPTSSRRHSTLWTPWAGCQKGHLTNICQIRWVFTSGVGLYCIWGLNLWILASTSNIRGLKNSQRQLKFTLKISKVLQHPETFMNCISYSLWVFTVGAGLIHRGS